MSYSAISLYNNLDTFCNSHYNKIINRQFYCDHNTLSWSNYLGKEDFHTYEEYFYWVTNKLQFSVMLLDGSVLQIYYEIENSQIAKSSLAFLPNPELNYEYFRFDLDYKNKKDFNHSSYHVHFGYNTEELRFSLFHFPLPSEFIKFVFSLVYNEEEFFNFKREKFLKDLDELDEQYHHTIRLNIPY